MLMDMSRKMLLHTIKIFSYHDGPKSRLEPETGQMDSQTLFHMSRMLLFGSMMSPCSMPMSVEWHDGYIKMRWLHHMRRAKVLHKWLLIWCRTIMDGYSLPMAKKKLGYYSKLVKIVRGILPPMTSSNKWKRPLIS